MRYRITFGSQRSIRPHRAIYNDFTVEFNDERIIVSAFDRVAHPDNLPFRA